MLESPKLGEKTCSEWVDQTEYELTKMSTSWPDNEYELTSWVRIDQNHEYELTKMRTDWLEYEMTWVRVDWEPSFSPKMCRKHFEYQLTNKNLTSKNVFK